MITPSGTISVPTMTIRISDWPRNLYLASAKAAIELISSVISVATRVTISELAKKRPKLKAFSGSV